MKEKISEIKEKIESVERKDRKQVLDKYRQDERSGVQKLIAKYDKEEEKLQIELQRLEVMKQYEREYEQFGYVCGIALIPK